MRTIFRLFIFFSIINVYAQDNFLTKERKIDSIMNAHIIHNGKKPVHSFLLYANNETNGFYVHKGVGTIGRNDSRIDEEYQFNCASITKTFVATIILQLEEEGKLKISDKANKYLLNIPFININNIHIYKNVNYSQDITIKQLLTHTSGISDIFSDAATRFNLSVLLHKKRMYGTERIMNTFYKYKLNKKPFNAPGKGYHYSDINYMLLGFIIESITQKTLPEAIRERILDKIKMNKTYFEYYEPKISEGKRIDAFLGRINMTKDINTSYEWGGGGLVTTTKDLAIFIEALFKNKLFINTSTLDEMLDFSITKPLNANYGLGLFKFEFNGGIYYGHGGFYGSLLLYNPIKKITLSANIGQATPPYNSESVVKALLYVLE